MESSVANCNSRKSCNSSPRQPLKRQRFNLVYLDSIRKEKRVQNVFQNMIQI